MPLATPQATSASPSSQPTGALAVDAFLASNMAAQLISSSHQSDRSASGVTRNQADRDCNPCIIVLVAPIYLALDGDNIGSRLELHILNEDIEGLQEFTKSFNSVLNGIVSKLRQDRNIDILLLGGDSLLITLPDSCVEAVIRMIVNETANTTFTFSGGYGSSMRHAYLALKIAKASGKNRICSVPPEISK